MTGVNHDFWNKNKKYMLKKTSSLNHSKTIIAIEQTHSFCSPILNNAELTVFFCLFLDMKTLYSFSLIDDQMNNHISKSKILAKMVLKRIIVGQKASYSALLKMNDISMHQLNEIYHDHQDICINYYQHPFIYPTDDNFSDCTCIKTKEMFLKNSASIDNIIDSVTIDDILHYKMTSKNMEFFHKTFTQNISTELKKLIPFSNSRIPSCFVDSLSVRDFINQQNHMSINDEIEEQTIEAELWQKLKITIQLDSVILETKPLNKKIPVRDTKYFIKYWEQKFFFIFFVTSINWDKFEVMGGSIFEAVTALSGDSINTPETDLDIFAHDISYTEFLQELVRFEQHLIRKHIKCIKSIESKKIFTYILILRNTFIKIQFIFTCLSANIATILNSFDLSPVQVAFNPKTMMITYTKAFLSFLQTGIGAVFNITQNLDDYSIARSSRIIKYQRKGIKHWKIPLGIKVAVWNEQLNAALRVYRQQYKDIIQLNGTTVHKYCCTEYENHFFTPKCCIRSANHDETNILKTFLSLYY